MFRTLRADEIELRVGTCSGKGFSLLLYKDARCDMNILDETVGSMYWKREHARDNANCIVSIWSSELSEWVSKEDTGTESNTEKEKGLASDSFKRACVNWGIGRELYTAPFIWISGHTVQANGKYKTDGYDRDLKVTDIGYDDNRNINYLVIKDKNSKSVFSFKDGKSKTDTSIDNAEKSAVTSQNTANPASENDRVILTDKISILIEEQNLDLQKIYKKVGVSSFNDITTDRLPGMIDWLQSMGADLRKELSK